jgi:hypothetical protein
MHIKTLLRAAGAALAAGAVLAACGTGESGPPASEAERATWLDAVTQAADMTVKARTARTAIELKEGADDTAATGEGVYDARSGRVRLAVVDDAGVTGGIIFDRNVVYVEIPEDQRAAIPGGKRWLKIDVAAIAGASDAGLQNLAQTGNVDPTQGLVLLKGMTADIRRVGTESLRGATTTHYRGKVDLDKLLAVSAAQVGSPVHQALQQVESSSFPTDVWVDGSGRLRKMRYEMTVRGKDGKGKAARQGTIEFFDFGTTARIHLPAEDQVFDFSELLAQMRVGKAGDGRQR